MEHGRVTASDSTGGEAAINPPESEYRSCLRREEGPYHGMKKASLEVRS